MADLESRITGDKTVSYISDSDDEKEGDQESIDDLKQFNDLKTPYDGPQTGPKGVLEDYKQYKNLCKAEEIIATKEKIELHKKLAFTADPNKHPDKTEDEEGDSDEEYNFDDDEFLKEYHQNRLEQMQNEMEEKFKLNMAKFGKLFDLQTGEELLEVLEGEEKNVIVIVHLYDQSLPACVMLSNCLEQLAAQYTHVRFCKISSTRAGLSLQFKVGALPAIQVYKGGVLIGNYIKMQDHLDKIFYTADVENFFIEKDIIPSASSSRKNYDDFDIVDEDE